MTQTDHHHTSHTVCTVEHTHENSAKHSQQANEIRFRWKTPESRLVLIRIEIIPEQQNELSKPKKPSNADVGWGEKFN